MRDFGQEIDRCTDWGVLSDLLEELSDEIDRAYDDPTEDPSLFDAIHDLELLLRYGEQKLERMLE